MMKVSVGPIANKKLNIISQLGLVAPRDRTEILPYRKEKEIVSEVGHGTRPGREVAPIAREEEEVIAEEVTAGAQARVHTQRRTTDALVPGPTREGI